MGQVTVIDLDGSRQIEYRAIYLVDEGGSRENIRRCIDAFNERHIAVKNRLISISYHRDPFTGEYTGLNTDIINTVAHRYRIHPEILMWHFGSNFGLDPRFFPFAAPPLRSALSDRKVCHLRHHRHHRSLFSFCLHASDNPHGATTVIIFARNLKFQDWDLLVSRLRSLDSQLPFPPAETASRWSNDLFAQALMKRGPEDNAACVANPIEYIIPYAQMILISASFFMDTWANNVVARTSSNLEKHYDKQLSFSGEIQQNLDSMKVFTTATSSTRWKGMLVDYQRVLESTEQQINVVLAQKMTYRAAMASLNESRLSIEHAKRGIQQNDRVKKLTQLAFIVIPLSFSTSAFGMNLEVLGTGTAHVWMVVVTVVLVYFSTGLLWMLLYYRAKITAARSPARDFAASSRGKKSNNFAV